ncbi:unnamed protein product [Parnassius apollo]|uniref:(apollo) hypothetical protein n=1 Tax=Parnassius apollo TaxID=110799 RepID=A0A8S3XSB1_PARAO|nr:unnamed protein product [Parnassius apollo]
MMCFLDPQTALHAEFTSLFNVTSKFPNIVSESDIQLIDNEFRELKLNMEVANLLCSTSSREAVTNVEEFWASSALYEQKIAEDEEFNFAMDNLMGDEWNQIWEALWDNETILEEAKIDNGILIRQVVLKLKHSSRL